MRKYLIVAVGVLALATAGLAVGKGLKSSKAAKAVAGTFAATTASHVDTKTCTTSDGKTIVTSHGKYAGLSAGDPDFTGPITLDVHSVVNTTDNVGVVTGKLKIDSASGKTTAHYDAVYDGVNLAGLAGGHAGDPGVKLLANLSAGFTTAGGFTSGKLGGGTAGGLAVELGPGKCAPEKKEHPASPAHDTKVKDTKKKK
jgi:hypothetical protein